MKFNDLTIITITFNNEKELLFTMSYINPFIDLGAKSVIINGGNKLKKNIFHNNCTLIQEKDRGIFDALNKGMTYVKTKFFMNVHSGDKLIINEFKLFQILNKMKSDNFDLAIGNQLIPFRGFKRKHSSYFWRPLLLNFGVQPPHMPTIYDKNFVSNLKYDYKNTVIADFFFFKDLFANKPKWFDSKEYLIEMGPGGNTTSGFGSILLVSKELIKNYGIIKGIFISAARLPFKILQAIK